MSGASMDRRQARRRRVLGWLGVDLTPTVADEGEPDELVSTWAYVSRASGRTFDVALQTVICALYVTILVVVNIAVFYRYVLDSPIIWSDTIAVWSFIWMSMLAAGLAVPTNAHMRIDVIPNRVNNHYVVFAFRLSTAISFVLAGALLVKSGLGLIDVTGDRKGTAVDVPIKYAMYAIPVGGAVFVVQGARAATRAVGQLRGRQSEAPNAEERVAL